MCEVCCGAWVNGKKLPVSFSTDGGSSAGLARVAAASSVRAEWNKLADEAKKDRARLLVQQRQFPMDAVDKSPRTASRSAA